MRLTSTSALLSALLPLLAHASVTVEPVSPTLIPKPLDITLHVTFPDNAAANLSSTSVPSDSRIILTNGIANKINIQLTNQDKTSVLGVRHIYGSLTDPKTELIVRNLTNALMGLELQPGQHADLPYAINLDMHPQVLELKLNVAVTKDDEPLTIHAWKGEAEVVEQPMSLLDPQLLFLYLFILSAIGGTAYWGYNKYLDSVNPRRHRQAQREPKVTTVRRETIMRAESPTTAVASGVSGGKYDESWIPEHHIKKEKAGRSRTPRSK